MKKLVLAFTLSLVMASCVSQEKFKGANPTTIHGEVNRIEKNICGSYIVSVTTKEYGRVEIHYVPRTACLLDIPVYVGRNGKLYYRKK
jgi:hypothetical protein